MVPDSTDNTTVKKFYQDLFNIQGYIKTFMNFNDHATVSYYSHAEYHPTFVKHAPTVERTMQCQMARAKQDQIESNKEYVCKQLTKMKEQVWYVSGQHAMELLLHVSIERVIITATVVMHISSCGDNFHRNCKGFAKQE